MTLWHEYIEQHARQRPKAPAFGDSGGARWTYGDLARACNALRTHLADLGIGPGDRVMLLCENCCAAVAALFATSQLGAVAVPVNARMRAAEVDRILAHAQPAAVLLTAAASPDAAAHASRLGAQRVEGDFGCLHVVSQDAGGKSCAQIPEGLAVLLYTTGTTGDPKGVMLSHDNLSFGGGASARLRDMTTEDVVYGVLPLSHVFGLASVLTASVMIGAEVRLETRFTAERFYQALRSGVTLVSAVPQMHALVMQYAKEQGLDHLGSPDLRYVSSGAAPLDPDWKRRAEAFYGVALQNGYGMTEATAGICATRNRLGDSDTSVGPPLPGVDVRLDQSVPGGGDGLGEICLRGGNVMLGYFGNLEATQAVLDPAGWLRSGDMGRLDESGNLHIDGRAKELIIHGGFNVFPPEVEAALNAHPQVIQSAVVGRPQSGDEQVVAFVQVAVGDEPKVDELRAFVAEQLAGYKRPGLIILTDQLPAAPTGKILKHMLLTHFADQLT
ncbi:long-chain fatty acid--CoA ligase [Phaeobacter inhibens]|uniref:class I adenylate-forming enzyme family protein n=1 Tax=Phaeobacter inhibens TaxID=221822 RepID=UPI000160D2AB|nr:class I adenylate-forming enzyme family protein [Phaeobacter inhibens]AFO86391.1 putative crotonobetaine/carnitine-CoA ligase [Phaeobacter inhibens 2.10]AXT41227.1 long-chain fatty acid--CoA ligase [Phaeobacter inhibens]